MIKKINNIQELTVTIIPSHKDLVLKTLSDKSILKIHLPAEFLMGMNWKAEMRCKKCNQIFDFGFSTLNFKSLSRLSNHYIYNTDYLDYLASPFSHLGLREIQKKQGRVYYYYFKDESTVKVFITYCPHCDATYLGSFAEQYGGEIERSPADMSPDYVYIDELVMVDIDREKFMEEFKINQR